MRKIAVVLSVAGMLAAGGAATPAGATPGQSSSPAMQAETIRIVAFSYHPNDLTALPGQPLQVVNVDWKLLHEPHTFTSVVQGDFGFNTGVITSTPAVVFAPVKTGKYVFICEIHPGMYGVLHVVKP